MNPDTINQEEETWHAYYRIAVSINDKEAMMRFKSSFAKLVKKSNNTLFNLEVLDDKIIIKLMPKKPLPSHMSIVSKFHDAFKETTQFA
jgi:hypothetical protein